MLAAVQFSQFRYSYPGSQRPELEIEDLEIKAGEFCCLVGASGAGKSTLCRVLCGLIPHFYHGDISGSSLVFGDETRQKSIAELAGCVGYVMDDPFDQLTRATGSVFAEVAFGLQNTGMPVDVIRQRVAEALVEMEISELAERAPAQLSTGQQQRVVLAAVFARQPDILVMDEATSQLDPQGAAAVYKLAKTFKEHGKTVIVVEPKLDRVLEHADRMLVLERGRLVASGSPREVLAQGTLERLHLELPSYASLANELRGQGWTQAQAPVRLDEARQMVLEALDGNP